MSIVLALAHIFITSFLNLDYAYMHTCTQKLFQIVKRSTAEQTVKALGKTETCRFVLGTCVEILYHFHCSSSSRKTVMLLDFTSLNNWVCESVWYRYMIAGITHRHQYGMSAMFPWVFRVGKSCQNFNIGVCDMTEMYISLWTSLFQVPLWPRRVEEGKRNPEIPGRWHVGEG